MRDNSARVVFRDDPFVDFDEGCVEFRLTYQGLLLSDNGRASLIPARATHKQEIRKHFHPQLRRFWEITPVLSTAGTSNPLGPRKLGSLRSDNSWQGRADNYARCGYRFVPLVCRQAPLLCSIDVLYLRSNPPGNVMSSGDLDNRLKTLFDGLCMPRDCGQLGAHTSPAEGEDPFFCLLEDDSLITKVTAETDTLLAPIDQKKPNDNDARVIITVKLRPAVINADTLGFL